MVFKHNTPSAIAALAAYTYLLSYPLEMARKKGVPAIMLYSKECATGKSTALNLAGKLHGMQNTVRVKFQN